MSSLQRSQICLVRCLRRQSVKHLSSAPLPALNQVGHSLLPAPPPPFASSSSKQLPQTHQQVKGRRRFYKKVSVREVPDKPGHWQLLLDNSVLRTPARQPLEFDSLDIAAGVAQEWDCQTVEAGIEPGLMPLMSLASTAIDQVAVDPEPTIRTILSYLPTDTICYLAKAEEVDLRRRQDKDWGRVRKLLKEDLGLELVTTNDIASVCKHPSETLERAAQLVAGMDPWCLAALQCLTMECKSLGLALALAFRKISVREACRMSRLEEEWNVEQWGMVEGGHDLDR